MDKLTTEDELARLKQELDSGKISYERAALQGIFACIMLPDKSSTDNEQEG
jgi:hypothetical protein